MKKKNIINFVKALTIIISAFSAVYGFFKLWKPFGRMPNKEAKKDYEKRAGNFFGGKFRNINDVKMNTSYNDLNAERKDIKGTSPKSELVENESNFPSRFLSEDVAVTWFGHSSILIQMNYQNILIDPVFSKRTSPLQWIGPKRYDKLPVNISELPDIDVCVISHDHYDHLDYRTIKKIDSKVYEYVVPLGVEQHLIRFGVDPKKIRNMAWWEETEINGLKIVCTPSQHFSGRKLIDNNTTLWASWIFMDETHKIFESGDTGFSNHFKDIHDKYGDMDLVMLDSSQYNESWHNVHMFPEEAVEAANILGAKYAMPVHWGAFVLSNHSWDDPVNRFSMSAEELGITCVSPEIGETLYLSNADSYINKWWQDIE